MEQQPTLRTFKRICVFCGSSSGSRPEYQQAAGAFGYMLAKRGIGLVYGGGNIGLMGALADGALAAGGEAIGVIPEALMNREIAGRRLDHPGLTRLEVVDSMHTRKARMAQLADGFIALPGGCGTFEELFEIITWAQLGFHDKPCGLLNILGFYDPLLALLDKAVAEGFLKETNRNILLADTDPQNLLARMQAFKIEKVEKWIESEKTL